jgi:dephospho-CoA kinase
VQRFGREVLDPDGSLNRTRLSQLAFKEGRLQDLNAIVHPAVIEAQQRWMDEIFAHDPAAVAVVESALIFEVVRDARARGEKAGLLADWRRRIDRIIVVTAPDPLKIARFAARVSPSAAGREAAEAEGRRRLSHQIPDAEKAALADYVIENIGDKQELRTKVAVLWQKLKADSNISPNQLSLK